MISDGRLGLHYFTLESYTRIMNSYVDYIVSGLASDGRLISGKWGRLWVVLGRVASCMQLACGSGFLR